MLSPQDEEFLKETERLWGYIPDFEEPYESWPLTHRVKRLLRVVGELKAYIEKMESIDFAEKEVSQSLEAQVKSLEKERDGLKEALENAKEFSKDFYRDSYIGSSEEVFEQDFERIWKDQVLRSS